VETWKSVAIAAATVAGVLFFSRKRVHAATGPLRAQALQVALVEDRRWGDAAPNTARVDDYLSGVEPHGSALVQANTDTNRVNFCAAAVGWTEHQTDIPERDLPPWRAGAKQIMIDAIQGLRPQGVWHPKSDLKLGWEPPEGALAVYTRGDPDGPFGHIDRVELTTPNGYMAVGANERGRRWTVEFSPYASEALLGFVVDGPEPNQLVKSNLVAPRLPLVPPNFVEPLMTDEEHAKIRGLT
jgi:hypothetical protein